jgi:uncharacterized membrane protein
MEVYMMETNNFNYNGGQTISCPLKKLNRYNFLLAFCAVLLFLSIVSVAWTAEITYPVSTFNDGKARFYEYKTSDGIVVRYFILKSSDGVIRAAFDACDVCWEAGKGYVQKDEFMVCKNCGRRFHSTKINEVSGGCNPVPLIRKIQDGKVVIDTQNILPGKRYFDLKGKRG